MNNSFEPVAWAVKVVGGRKWLSIHASKGASDRWLEYRVKEQAQGEKYEQHALYTTPPAAPVQEPAFHGFVHKDECRVEMCFTPSAPRADGTYATAFYTTPPAAPVQHDECVVCGDKVRVIPRPWVGLTDEDWKELHLTTDACTYGRAIEAKLKEKNHG